MSPSTSFFCTKLNATTFLIIEDDSYDEQPHIYVKIYPDLIFVSDTGCNSPRKDDKVITSLRQYLETYPVQTNNNSPLNPSGMKPYLILCTHCHYDHILGISPFLSSPDDHPAILASSHSKSFILDDLPAHSLCKILHIRTPSYHISYWAHHLSYLSYSPPTNTTTTTTTTTPYPLRIQLLHTPGHTPDSLAWYDIDAHHLYIGDTFYARRRDPSSRPLMHPLAPSEKGTAPPLPAISDASIIFPLEGNLITYMSTLSLLLSFARHQNSLLEKQWRSLPGGGGSGGMEGPEQGLEYESVEAVPPRVLLGCGHVTAAGDAEEMTREVQAFFWGIVKGEVEVRRSERRRGEWFDYWVEPGGEEEGGDGGGRYSVLAPRRLVEEARAHFGVHLDGR